MPNVKISAAADPGALLGTDMVPMARSGQATAYRATLAEIASYTGAQAAAGTGNIGRNLIHNAMFNVQQRGGGPFTAVGAYTADRWQLIMTADTASIALSAANDAQRAQIGDEAVTFLLTNTFTGTSGATAQTYLTQKIEKVQRLSGKSVTISFWAAASATQKLGVNLAQVFGTGGTPSANAWATAQAVQLSGTWTRYSVTIAVPSAAGKTLGSNGDDSTWLAFYYSSGANSNALAGNIGVQSGTIQLWGIQLEVGSGAGFPSPLEKLDPRLDLANCQRFYQAGQYWFFGYSQASSTMGYTQGLPTKMRAIPTAALSGQAYTNASGATATGADGASLIFYCTVTASGAAQFNGNYTASADL